MSLSMVEVGRMPRRCAATRIEESFYNLNMETDKERTRDIIALFASYYKNFEIFEKQLQKWRISQQKI